MSETKAETVMTANETPDGEARPWQGATNPLESLWQHFTAEIAKIGGADKIKPLEDRVAALESENTKLKTQAEKAAHDLIDVKETVAAQADAGPVADALVTSAYMPPGDAV